MRTSSAVLLDKPRLLCFSTRVMLDCCDRFGSVQGLFDAMGRGEKEGLEALLWTAARMMQAGEVYAEHNGLDLCEPVGLDELLDMCGVDDIPAIRAAVLATVLIDTEREQEAEPPKNAEATPPDR